MNDDALYYISSINQPMQLTCGYEQVIKSVLLHTNTTTDDMHDMISNGFK